MTSLLAKEILQKEEMLLKETKARLLEQLNRLKVEEVALRRYLLDNTENQQTQENNAQILENNKYQTTSGNNEDSSYTDDANALNQMPLENLKPNDTKQMDQDIEEEEEEEEEDDQT
ncbi:snRNA-activating protein complex subunit 5-like [Actinia tenebrosa]|uniref:snRNA-activating protein complex subunit 5-like n=1 Tax=Actinia tenebrosa TaxID=6105 RepID=A0A6P8INA8_ACTTE|nr:snRNA-activating protein complex subunit 5-like [Actinia tenebrosa]